MRTSAKLWHNQAVLPILSLSSRSLRILQTTLFVRSLTMLGFSLHLPGTSTTAWPWAEDGRTAKWKSSLKFLRFDSGRTFTRHMVGSPAQLQPMIATLGWHKITKVESAGFTSALTSALKNRPRITNLCKDDLRVHGPGQSDIVILQKGDKIDIEDPVFVDLGAVHYVSCIAETLYVIRPDFMAPIPRPMTRSRHPPPPARNSSLLHRNDQN